LVEERVDGSVAYEYAWDQRYIDAPIVRFQDANTDGDYADAEDNVLYYTNDANMNVTALVDESGTVVERYAYDPYGQVTVLDADWSTDADGVSDVNNEVLYAGYRFDPETGLFHVRNRYYSTSLGRFTARDPLGYVDGMSVYEYVGGNPIHYVDSLGERPVLMGPDGQPQDPPPTEEEMQRMLKLERQQRAKDRVDPMGLSSRKTKYWHVRGYGATKIKATFAGEIEHSVISVDMSDKIGVDYGPADKKGGKKGGKKKKVSGLAWLLWGETGKTDWTWNIQFPLDYNRTSEKWQLCIRNADTMKVDDKDVECKCATEDQIKTCITRVAKAWNGTTWKRGHDCRHFVQAAESECCLEKCSQ
jgi:RHS repeat-associated protein